VFRSSIWGLEIYLVGDKLTKTSCGDGTG